MQEGAVIVYGLYNCSKPHIHRTISNKMYFYCCADLSRKARIAIGIAVPVSSVALLGVIAVIIEVARKRKQKREEALFWYTRNREYPDYELGVATDSPSADPTPPYAYPAPPYSSHDEIVPTGGDGNETGNSSSTHRADVDSGSNKTISTISVPPPAVLKKAE